MKWIQGWDRQQVHPLPERIEDYVGQDNPVRFVDAFVDKLDLRQAGFAFPKEDRLGRGRPGYHPGVLLKLYLYGYLNQLRTSRRLEAECGRNLEVMWLLGGLRPDHKTIADFRKDNAGAFQAVVRKFTRLCRRLGLFGGQLLAVDGTKVKAQNAADQNWTQSKLEQQQSKLEGQVQRCEQALAQAQQAQGPLPAAQSAPALEGKRSRLHQQEERLEQRQQALTQAAASEVSVSDPESRGMRCQGRHVVGYNVQGVVDAKHHLLVVTEVSQAASDQGQLAPMAQAAVAALELKAAEMLADGGYFKSQDIARCRQLGLEPYLPALHNSPSVRAGLYGKEDFHYRPEPDVYECPAGALLQRQRTTQDKGRELFNYTNAPACAHCELKARCTRSAFRAITRWQGEEVLERMAQQVEAHPEKLARRKTLIEHCWGTLKWLLAGGFLVRGLAKVRAEVSLAHFAYNLKRAIAVVGVEKLLEELKNPAWVGATAGATPITILANALRWVLRQMTRSAGVSRWESRLPLASLG